MTSHDVRDMLDLPGSSAPRPSKKQKIAAPRQVLKGLAREVQNLGGDNPIAIVPEVSTFKKRRLAVRKPAARWDLKPFKNTAREDGLILRHWRRLPETPTISVEDENTQGQMDIVKEVEDSTFAKFNVKVNIAKYDHEQYEKANLQSEDWSREETDYLMGLVHDYDLRWPIISDRYEYKPPAPAIESVEGAVVPVHRERTMEDMKARYYKIAANLMALQKPVHFMNGPEFALHELMTNFNPGQETSRKKFAEATFSRSKEEAREEESLLMELKRIIARSDKLNEERRELFARLDAPATTSNISAYTTSAGLQSLFQSLLSTSNFNSKKRRSLMGPEGVSPAGPSAQQSGYDRRDSSHRDSISGSVSTISNKRGFQQTPTERRKLTEEEEKLYGVTYHEKLTPSGPHFRQDKITKGIINKSASQQLKMSGVFAELGLSLRLTMATADTVAEFELLMHDINYMLDCRKTMEKLKTEITTARALKEERDRKARAAKGEPVEGDAEGEDVGAADGDAEERLKEGSAAPSVRAGSVKRSASVISAISDKSAKRQKK
ncbi:hypothetical protein B7494_g1495 [Chlorociboria aeruginascens]|nr:hypothetical protein B7494_g1495 [Chlorociboria aeruginascens]